MFEISSNRKATHVIQDQEDRDLSHEKGKVAVAVNALFESPIHPKTVGNRRIVHATKPRSLFAALRLLVEKADIGAIYGPQLKNPSTPVWEAFRTAILAIEKCFDEQGYTDQELAPIRLYVNIYLSGNASFNSKMAELAAIHYFLEREGKIPQTQETFVALRCTEVNAELTALSKAAKTLLPNACTAYLQRVFARMLLTAEGQIRPGGVQIVGLLLASPLGIEFNDQYRHHLENILRALENPSFTRLVNKPIAIAPSMEEVVRLELKLDKEIPMSEYLIKLSLLIALLTDLRQGENEPNCYAVANLMGLLYGNPEKVYEYLCALLKSGTLRVDLGPSLPLQPLFRQRMDGLWADAKLVNFKESDFVELPAVQAFFRFTGAHVSSPSSIHRVSSAVSALSALIPGSMQSARHFLSSFLNSPLQQLMIAAIQMHETNAVEADNEELLPTPKKFSFLIHLKRELIRHAKKTAGGAHGYSKLKQLLNNLMQRWTQSLWIQDITLDKTVIGSHGSLTVHYPDGKTRKRIMSKKIAQEMEAEFKAERRLVYLDQGKLVLIEDFDEFQKLLVQWLHEEWQRVQNPALKKCYQAVLKVLNGPKFPEIMAQLLESVNQSDWPQLNADQFRKWAELLFASDGGANDRIFSMLNIQHRAILKKFSTDGELLLNLMHVLQHVQEAERGMIININSHVFVVSR